MPVPSFLFLMRTHVANICVTPSGMVQRILDSPRMVAVVCYLVGDSCMIVHGFDSITLLFSDAPVSGVCSKNSGVMLPKSRMKCTRVKDQITHNCHHSWVGLEHILPNRVSHCHCRLIN
jgi:hypothetical protein